MWCVASVQSRNSSTNSKTKISNPLPILQALQILFQPDHLTLSQVWPSAHPKNNSIGKEENKLKSNCELGLNDRVRQSNSESTAVKSKNSTTSQNFHKELTNAW